MSMISIQVEGLRRLADRTYNRYTQKALREAADTIETLSAKLAGVNLGELVEVVRCKECKHWNRGRCWGIPFSGDDASYIETEADDFCSYGQRK